MNAVTDAKLGSPARLDTPQLAAYRARRAALLASIAGTSAGGLGSAAQQEGLADKVHPRCAAVFFYHLPKAGGSFVRNTVNRLVTKDNPHGPWCVRAPLLPPREPTTRCSPATQPQAQSRRG